MIHINRVHRTRRKTVALIVERDGSLTVRAPLRTPEHMIQAFVESKSDWIAKQQAKLAQAARAALREYQDGETFLFLGVSYPLRIVERKRPALELSGGVFGLSRQSLPQAEDVFVRWYRSQAAQVFAERIAYYAAQSSFTYKKMRISSARTRWGSCSSTGTLSFTWRLVMAPQEVIDYVVVHELVHLRIKNHSREFWDGVAAILPDYKRRRAWLKTNGRSLALGDR
jgi:predicted metal-dependent hydrolase